MTILDIPPYVNKLSTLTTKRALTKETASSLTSTNHNQQLFRVNPLFKSMTNTGAMPKGTISFHLIVSIYTSILGLSALPISAQAEVLNAVNTSSPEKSFETTKANLPSATLDTIIATATPLQASEQTDDYIIPITNSATGLDLTAKETPQSTTVVTDQQIKDQSLDDLSEVIENTVGIDTFKFDGGKNGFTARGFRIEQYLVDGLDVDADASYTAGEHLSSMAIYDHVEVVRGANGLMAGSGQPSASVNLIRKHATSVEPTAEVSFNANNFNNYGASLDIGSALTGSGKVRGRFIAEYQDGDSFIEREERGHQLAYAIIDADMTEDTTANVGIKYQKNKQHSAMWGGMPTYYSDGSKTDWPIDKNVSADWVEWHSEHTEYFGGITHQINDALQFELKGSHAQYTTDDKLFYVYGSVIDKSTGLGPQPYPGRYAVDRTQDNVQAKLTGKFAVADRLHQMMVGASYSNNDLKADAWESENVAPLTSLLTWDGSYPEPTWKNRSPSEDRTTQEKAIFAATQLELTDQLALTLGSRVSDYKQTKPSDAQTTELEANSVWTPFAGIVYDVSDNHSVYASYTDIFKPQSERDINNELLDPIFGKNYEIGLKSSNDTDTLQSQFSVFRIEQDNLAQPTGDIIPNTTPPTNAYRMSEGAVSRGIDVEVSGQLSSDWQATLGFTHFDIRDQDDAPLNTGVPNTLIKAFTTYNMDNTFRGLTVGAGINWSSERYALLPSPSSGNKEKYQQEPVAIVNLMARYSFNDNMDIQLNIDNVLDQKYIGNTMYFNQLNYGEPLTVKGKLTYRF